VARIERFGCVCPAWCLIGLLVTGFAILKDTLIDAAGRRRSIPLAVLGWDVSVSGVFLCWRLDDSI
jgi:hypothetical protein